jgi:hypothetical protein
MPTWYYIALGVLFLGLIGFLIFRMVKKPDD